MTRVRVEPRPFDQGRRKNEVHPPMLKLGQNWGKIANYPPSMLNKDRHPLFATLLFIYFCAKPINKQG